MIPDWIKEGSSLYKDNTELFSDELEYEFTKSDSSVSTINDLLLMIKIVNFWIFYDYPATMYTFVCTNKHLVFPILTELCTLHTEGIGNIYRHFISLVSRNKPYEGIIVLNNDVEIIKVLNIVYIQLKLHNISNRNQFINDYVRANKLCALKWYETHYPIPMIIIEPDRILPNEDRREILMRMGTTGPMGPRAGKGASVFIRLSEVFEYMCEHGYSIEFIKWFYEHFHEQIDGHRFHETRYGLQYCLYLAGKNGHIHILEYFLTIRFNSIFYNGMLDEYNVNNIATTKWMRDNFLTN